jgi:glycosyltransferase involved in cell wall biosynthesis
MKVLHITPHLGGGIGTVVMAWLDRVKDHNVACLDFVNEKVRAFSSGKEFFLFPRMIEFFEFLVELIKEADIVVVHYWDSDFLKRLFAVELPESRMAFWCHKHYWVKPEVVAYPDAIFGVSPIQQFDNFIWSCGDMSRFKQIVPTEHKGFNVGYVGTVDFKKIHPEFLDMCRAIKVPGIHFTIVGENNIGGKDDDKFTFTGKVDDVAPYLAGFDVFGYPLRANHYGTAEQVLGEAMCSGVVPVCMDNPAERTIVDNSFDGFIASDEPEYIQKIEWLATHPIQRRTMGDRAREDADAIYNVNSMVMGWAMVFEKMMLQPKTKKGVL